MSRGRGDRGPAVGYGRAALRPRILGTGGAACAFAGKLGVAGLCAWAVVLGCGGPDEPGVEVRVGDAWVAAVVTAYEVDGTRDGDRTRVEVVYDLDDGSRLRLEMRVFFNPRPVLETGTWRLENRGAHPVGGTADRSAPEGLAGDDAVARGSGSVSAQSVRFTGGQNEGPSLGGRFLLEESAGPRFRVLMPLRPVRQPRWP